MTELYTDGRNFLHAIIGNANVKLSARLIGDALEFKLKDPSTIRRIGRDTVLVPLTDLLALTQKVDTNT